MELIIYKGKPRLIGDFSPAMLRDIQRIPTSRYIPRRLDEISFQPIYEALRGLDTLADTYQIDVSGEARRLIGDSLASHKRERQEIRKAARKFKKQATVLPVPLKLPPYEHQARAFGFCSSLLAAALLAEQGTGKTMVGIAVAGDKIPDDRLVVVCPKTVRQVWKREFKKHADFPYELVVYKKPTDLKKFTESHLQILVISYDQAARIKKKIVSWKPGMMILDESHRIKNRSTKRSRAFHWMGDRIQNKMILTGTPLGQSPVDAWSQYRFLDSRIFGRDWNLFKDRYCKMGGYMGYEIVGYKNLEEFAEKLHSIAFRCTKKECLDLPEESFQRLYIEMDAATKKIYKGLDLDFMAEVEGEEITAELVISKIAKLRQVTGGFVKNNFGELKKVSESKLSALREYLEDRDWTKKIVIFAPFTHEIDMIYNLCLDLKLKPIKLTGQTPENQRNSFEERFEKDKSIKVAIVQIDTGGEGIGLTAANEALFYSPTFSLIKYVQALARVHRIGQTSPVTYINMVMEGSIDEEIVNFIEENLELLKNILDNARTYRMRKTK